MSAMSPKPDDAGLERRTLGRTGLDVSVVSAGGFLGMVHDPKQSAEGPWGTTSKDASLREATAIAAVRRAVDLGISYFDTSPFYGNGEVERLLGVGLAGLSAEERTALVVSTKVGRYPEGRDYAAGPATESVHRSLRVLGLDHLPIVYLHDIDTDAQMGQALAGDGAVAAVERLRENGLVAAIGIGARSHRMLTRAIASGRFDVILSPYDYSPVRATAAGVFELAAQHQVGVVAASPYQAGLLAGGDPRAAAAKRADTNRADLERAVAVWDWCQARGLDAGALAVQFQLRNSTITSSLVGPRDAAEVEGNVRHASAAIDAGLWPELDEFLVTLPDAASGGEATAGA